MRRAWLLIAGAELTLLRRSPFTLTTAAALPTALGLLIVWAENDTARSGWASAAGLLLVTLMTFTAYGSATTLLAARRQQFVLKRLRHSGATGLAIVAGTLVLPTLLTLLQTALLFGLVTVMDDVPPVSIGPLLVAIVTGTVAACALAVATAAFTPTPEAAQLTTTPISLAFVGGAFWAIHFPPGETPWYALVLPGAAITELTRTGSLIALSALLLLTAAVTPVAVRVFSWDPRR
jgi:ABC-2 type transport system permease protein